MRGSLEVAGIDTSDGADTAEVAGADTVEHDGAEAADARRVADQTEFAARLRLVIGRIHRRVRIDGRESIPPLQLSALVTVEQSGPMRLSELARREAVTAPTMSRVLTALDEQGLVRRTVDPDDARGVQITLSEKGAAALREVRSHRTALLARRLARLDDAQLAALGAALPALESLLVDDEPTC
jgi:DNA-binding MarR family transcriptional regulator